MAHLAAEFYPGLCLVDWPDKKPGANREIDSLAESSDVRVAIEHTSVDSFEKQREDSARFMEAIGKLESELQGQIASSVRLIIHCGAVPTGIPWKTICDVLRSWIVNTFPTLPDGRSQQNIAGVPFLVYVWKDSTQLSGLSVARFAPEDHTLSERLRGQLKDKAAKLSKYKQAGWFTVLLLESSDIALMNLNTMRSAVEAACSSSLPAGADSIWYADSAISGTFQFWDITPTRGLRTSGYREPGS